MSRQSALDVGVLIFNSWGNLARGPHKSHSSLPLLRAAGWETALVAKEHLRSILPTPPVSSSWAKRFCSLPAQPFLLEAAGKGAATFLLQGWVTQAFIFMPFPGQLGRTPRFHHPLLLLVLFGAFFKKMEIWKNVSHWVLAGMGMGCSSSIELRQTKRCDLFYLNCSGVFCRAAGRLLEGSVCPFQVCLSLATATPAQLTGLPLKTGVFFYTSITSRV